MRQTLLRLNRKTIQTQRSEATSNRTNHYLFGKTRCYNSQTGRKTRIFITYSLLLLKNQRTLPIECRRPLRTDRRTLQNKRRRSASVCEMYRAQTFEHSPSESTIHSQRTSAQSVHNLIFRKRMKNKHERNKIEINDAKRNERKRKRNRKELMRRI